jgi:glycosyltransferase involved in cell wall biosynthesis
LYTPKTVPGDNPYLSQVDKGNSRIVYPQKAVHRALNGSLWRSGLITSRLVSDRIDIYYGLSNEIPFGSRKIVPAKVVVIHDLIFLRYPKLYPAFDAFFYKKKSEYACRYARYIIAASEQTRQDIVDFYRIREDKITVIYPGTDPAFYSEDHTDPAEFFKPERKYLISIGAITPRKNLMQTMQAFNRVKDRFDLDIVVIGTATGLGRNYLKEIQVYIEKNGFTDRVHFLGNVPYKYVPGLCRGAELMVYPSQFEGFGMPIVEGLFSKIPVITSRGGCFPEAGGDGTVYIDPNDPGEIAEWIEKIMGSGQLRDEIIRKGLLYAERFKQSRIEDDIIRFHEKVKSSIEN